MNTVRAISPRSPHVPRRPAQVHPSSLPPLGQLLRFGTIGILNTAFDILLLNLLLWIFAIHTTPLMLVANAAAYGLGAVNSFVWNKYWTFAHGQRVTRQEMIRFAAVTLCGMGINDLLLGVAGHLLLPLMGSTVLWANLSKLLAVAGSMVISFMGMRLWVFTHRPAHEQPARMSPRVHMRSTNVRFGTPRTPARVMPRPRIVSRVQIKQPREWAPADGLLPLQLNLLHPAEAQEVAV